MPDGIFTLAAVVIGFLLGTGTDIVKSRLQEKKRAQTVRALVRLEFQKNMDDFRMFWGKVFELPANVGLDPTERDFLERLRFAELTMPPWERVTWDSQAGNLADAFPGSEHLQLEYAYDLMRRAQAIREARATIQAALADTKVGAAKLGDRFDDWLRRETNTTESGTANGSLPQDMLWAIGQFHERTSRAWAECERYFLEIARANPLYELEYLKLSRKRQSKMRSIYKWTQLFGQRSGQDKMKS